MSQQTIGLIGRKVGMTQVFQADGTMVAVSVVEVTPNTVTRLRTPERDDAHGDHRPVVLEHLGHADLAADQSDAHRGVTS